MTEIVRVPFHGDDILTVDVDGTPHVILKAAIEALGLDYWSQIQKLRGKSWARTRMVPVRDSAGRTQESITADVRTFLMLLATIDEKRVAADVAPKLIAYQAEVADVIEQHWTGRNGGEVARPASQLDILAGAIAEMQRMDRELAAAREEVREIGTRTNEAIATVTEIAARQDAIEGRHDWFAGLGYARLQGWSTDRKFLQRLGARAGRIGRAAGLKASKVQHGLYGEVNQWPAWCWDQAFEEIGGAA